MLLYRGGPQRKHFFCFGSFWIHILSLLSPLCIYSSLSLSPERSTFEARVSVRRKKMEHGRERRHVAFVSSLERNEPPGTPRGNVSEVQSKAGLRFVLFDSAMMEKRLGRAARSGDLCHEIEREFWRLKTFHFPHLRLPSGWLDKTTLRRFNAPTRKLLEEVGPLVLFLLGKDEQFSDFTSDFCCLIRHITMAWHTHPRAGNHNTNVAIGVLQSYLGLLEVHKALHEGQARKRKALAILRFVEPQYAWVLSKGRFNSESDALVAANLLSYIIDLFSTDVRGRQVIYLLYTDVTREKYSGRTSLLRRSGNGRRKGFAVRWYEHQKQLLYHFAKEAKNPRSRYKHLLKSGDFLLRPIPLQVVDDAIAQVSESLTIQNLAPEGNDLLRTPGYVAHEKGKQVSLTCGRKRKPYGQRQRERRLMPQDVLEDEAEQHFRAEKEVFDSFQKLSMNKRLEKLEACQKQEKVTRGSLQEPFAAMYEKQCSTRPVPLWKFKATEIVRFASEKPRQVPWGAVLLNKKWTADDCVWLFEHCRLLPKPLDRSRARASLKQFGSLHGLRLGGAFCLKWYGKTGLAGARAEMHGSLVALSQQFPRYARYVSRETRKIPVRPEAWKFRIFNAPAESRRYDWRRVALLDESEIQDFLKGKDMYRIPLNSHLDVTWTSGEYADAQAEALTQWKKRVGIILPGQHNVSFQNLFDCCCDFRLRTEKSRAAHDTFRRVAAIIESDLHPGGETKWCCTVEDKDPKVVWLQRIDGMMIRWIGLIKDQKRWSVTKCDHRAVLRLYQNLSNSALPRSLQPADMQFGQENVPYSYPTVKLKCFRGKEGENKHTCPKAGHSCLRNICSFIKLKGRRSYKATGRALRAVIDSVSERWSVTSQKTVLEEFQKGFENLRRERKFDCSYPRQCARCSATMCAPGAVCEDAGQAFEAVPRMFVSFALRYYFRLAGFEPEGKTEIPEEPVVLDEFGHALTSTGEDNDRPVRKQSVKKRRDAPVTVFKTMKCLTKLGGYVKDFACDRNIFWLSRVLQATFVLLQMVIFKFGNWYVQQVSGLPIGGPVSSVVLEFCLAWLEERMDKYKWKGFSQGTCFQTRRRSDVILAKRYVDDVCCVSLILCDSCLHVFIQTTYKDKISFEDATEKSTEVGVVHIKFLDCWFSVQMRGVSTFMHIPNFTYLMTGNGEDLKKNRGPWRAGDPARVDGALLQDFQVRLARLRQLKSEPLASYVVLVFLFAEYKRLGYSFHKLQVVWSRIKFQDMIHRIGTCALMALRRHYAHNTQIEKQKVLQKHGSTSHSGITQSLQHSIGGDGTRADKAQNSTDGRLCLPRFAPSLSVNTQAVQARTCFDGRLCLPRSAPSLSVSLCDQARNYENKQKAMASRLFELVSFGRQNVGGGSVASDSVFNSHGPLLAVSPGKTWRTERVQQPPRATEQVQTCSASLRHVLVGSYLDGPVPESQNPPRFLRADRSDCHKRGVDVLRPRSYEFWSSCVSKAKDFRVPSIPWLSGLGAKQLENLGLLLCPWKGTRGLSSSVSCSLRSVARLRKKLVRLQAQVAPTEDMGPWKKNNGPYNNNNNGGSNRQLENLMLLQMMNNGGGSSSGSNQNNLMPLLATTMMGGNSNGIMGMAQLNMLQQTLKAPSTLR